MGGGGYGRYCVGGVSTGARGLSPRLRSLRGAWSVVCFAFVGGRRYSRKKFRGRVKRDGIRSRGAALEPALEAADPAPLLPWPPVPVPPYQPPGALVSDGGGDWVWGPGGHT